MDAEPSKETGKAQAAAPHWFDANDVSHWYNPATEFGEDALQLWNEQVMAQSERFQSIHNPIDFIDWFSYGLFSANQSRGNTMLEDPSLYNISNWLTSGIPDTAKGTLFPDKPFSPEHWLNSFEMASLFMGSLKLAQYRAAMFDPKGAIDGAGRGSGDVGGGAGKVYFNSLDDFVNKPKILGEATPEQLYKNFLDNGYNPQPLSGGRHAGKLFSEGGGYIIRWGGDRALEYHPGGLNHHGNIPYYRISSGSTGKMWFDLNGNPLP